VLEFQTKDRVWIRQLKKRAPRVAPRELIAAAACTPENPVGQRPAIEISDRRQ